MDTRWKLAFTGVVVAVSLMAMVALAACGGSTDGAANSAQSKAAEVSTCLRKYGIVLSDTGPGKVPPGMTPTELTVALSKCDVRNGKVSGSLQVGVVNAAKRAVVERELRKISACLRVSGFAVTTPKDVYEGPIFYPNGIDTQSTRFRRVERVCRRKFVAAIGKLGVGYAPGYGRETATDTTTSHPSSPSSTAKLAACVRRYGATVIQAGTQVGLRVPSHTSSAKLEAILKNCHIRSVAVEGGPK